MIFQEESLIIILAMLAPAHSGAHFAKLRFYTIKHKVPLPVIFRYKCSTSIKGLEWQSVESEFLEK